MGFRLVLPHHVTHEPGGTDVVVGVAPGAHEVTHRAAGSDALSLLNLAGYPADTTKFLRGDGSFQVPPIPAGVRQDFVIAGYGTFAETYPLAWSSGGTRVSASGRAWYTPIGLVAGDVVTGIMALHTVVGASSTTYKAALYDNTATRVAISGNENAKATVLGFQKLVLTSPYTVTTSGFYYIGWLHVGTTAPTIPFSLVINSAEAVKLRNTGGIRMYQTDVGPLSDLPTSFTPATLGDPPTTFGVNWHGVYT